MNKRLLSAIFVVAMGQSAAEVEVPAFTAYSSPDPNRGMNRSPEGAITSWDSNRKLSWYGHIAKKGELELSLRTAAEVGKGVKLQLPVNSQDKSAAGWERNGKAEGDRVEFGKVSIPKPGYYRFTLEGKGGRLPDLEALVLDGAASKEAHFSKVERRNSASVHLGYLVPENAKEEVEWFYLEVTPKTEPLWSYYMATGWHRGYFGIGPGVGPWISISAVVLGAGHPRRSCVLPSPRRLG